MAEGVLPGSIQELNEALKNSFLAIKNDMNFLRERLTSQESSVAEQLNVLSSNVNNTLAQMREEQKASQEAINHRIDHISEKLTADVNFLNEALSTMPQQVDTHDNGVLKAYIEKQLDELQSQITMVKQHSGAAQTDEKLDSSVKEITSEMSSLQVQLATLATNIEAMDAKNKDLNDKVYSMGVTQQQNASKQSISQLHKALDTILSHVHDIDARAKNLEANSPQVDVHQELDAFHVNMQERLDKLALDVEHKLSNHTVVENKNFETIKQQLLAFKNDLATFETTCNSIRDESETFVQQEHFKSLQTQLATFIKQAATISDIEKDREHIKVIADRISRSEEQIREEIDRYLEQERTARSEQVVTKEEIVSMITEAQDVTHGHMAQVEQAQKDSESRFSEYIEQQLSEFVRREDFDEMQVPMAQRVTELESSLQNTHKQHIETVEERIEAVAQDLTATVSALNEFKGTIQNFRTEVEMIQEQTVLQEHFDVTIDRFEKESTTHQKKADEAIKRINKTLDILSEDSATKAYVDAIDKATNDAITQIRSGQDKLSTSLKELNSARKELQKDYSKKIKELRKDTDNNADDVSRHQKMFEKVNKQMSDMRDDVSKNYDSARKLNKLVKKFGQLKEITIEEGALAPSKSISSQIKNLTTMFKKKQKTQPPTYKSWSTKKNSIANMEADISKSIKKLEKAPSLTDAKVPELLSSVRKVEEQKEELTKIEEHKKKKKKVGIIAQIGLDQGIITEKDLK